MSPATEWITTIGVALQAGIARVLTDYSAEGQAEWARLMDARDEVIDLTCESVGIGRRVSEMQGPARYATLRRCSTARSAGSVTGNERGNFTAWF